MKILKYALLGCAVLALVGAGVIAWLAYTFDARDYHPRIVQLVKERTGRTLKIDGELTLAFRPDPVLRLGRVTLSERDSDAAFVDVEDARVSMKLVPMFSRELIADEVSIAGAHVRVTRFADGRLNIDDLFRRGDGEIRFDIGRVKVERSAVEYRDLGAGTAYALTGVALETGRVADQAPTPVTLALNARDGAGRFDLVLALNGRLVFDLAQKTSSLDAASLEVKGKAGDIENITARLTGAVAAASKDPSLRASGISAAAKATFHGEALEITGSAGSLELRAGRAQADTVAAKLNAAGTTGTSHLQLTAPRIERNGEALHADRAAVQLDLNRGGHAIRVEATCGVDAKLDSGLFVFRGLDSRFHVAGARLPAKGIAGTLAGDARVDVAKEGIQVRLSGAVAGSRIKADVTAAGFASPAYTFAVDIDQLDTDRYAPRPVKGSTASPDALDLAALEALPASGTVRIGVLKSGGSTAKNVKLVVKP